MAFGALARHWTIWKAAWQAESSRPLGTMPAGRATEFLPAVLEIQQAPPSPIGRAILWTIMAVVIFCGVWLLLVAIAPIGPYFSPIHLFGGTFWIGEAPPDVSTSTILYQSP